MRLRGLGTTRARATTSHRRSVTSSRFRSWLREVLDTRRSRPAPSSRLASRLSSRWRCASLSDGEAPTSHQTSTRVDEVLTCWPPGPPEREARNSSSDERELEVRAMTSRWVASGMPKNNRVRPLTWSRTALRYCPCPTSNFCGVTCSALGRVLLGYSGGVDSALLAVVGRQALGPDRFLAVIGRSASYPEAQWRTRRRARPAVRRAPARGGHRRAGRSALPRQSHQPLLLLQDRAVDPPRRGGPGARLRHHHRRHQRRRPGRAPARSARRRGAPGPLAARGAGLEQGRGARGVARARACPRGTRRRRRASRAGWCTGSRSRRARLRQVEDGEAYLRALGVTGDLRVRHHGDRARIEVAPDADRPASATSGTP